ncbi:13313_t:CDS:2 [Acaulospora colombiana]|uniref:13313_t:CDS:1 n=1 Tax=Acaulospora colombiana TaxID=27376 RepID=A0ACA9JZF9_9GLOM|nr:13313_t:CDS:2 [Acaulospora colombiana]
MQTPFEKRVTETYDRALRRGELLFIESTVSKFVEKGIEFEIRISPSLAKKPAGDLDKVTDESTQKPKVNPFLPYNQELLVQEHGKHVILLNKFCVVPYHLLVVTKEYEKQTDRLNSSDLESAWYCIMQIKSHTSLAFYNCGELSGARYFIRYHRRQHLQVIPIPDDVLPLREIFEFSEFPFVHYVTLLDPQKSGRKSDVVGEHLNELYHYLLDTLIGDLQDQSYSTDTNPPSYNFVVTHTWMMIVPRSNEKYENLSVNSLGFVGMLLLRSEEELKFVKEVGILKILEGVTIPKRPNTNSVADSIDEA